MKFSILIVIALFCSSMVVNNKATETARLFLNGQEVKDKISLKATGKLEIVLPEGWRYISGKVKILNGQEVKISKSMVGEAGLKEVDLLQFIKTNGAPGNHLSVELSVRTKESGTLSSMKIPLE